jgi:alkylation response protein AidB-like acyl-CoA dehydrogenase
VHPESHPYGDGMLTSPAWPASAIALDTGAVVAAAGRLGASTADRLAFATWLGRRTPALTSGTAGAHLATLATVASVDVELARTVEPHLDALGILDQARADGLTVPDTDPDTTWGVFAAEGPGTPLTAQPDAGGAVLTGRKPWCSLASSLSHALVTAHTPDGRGLFAVPLRQSGVTTHDEGWVSRGMPGVPSGPVDLDRVPAAPVGPSGWYLERPGFAWGGIGVAACWWGGSVPLAAMLRDRAVRDEDRIVRLALGDVVLALADAEDALAGAAARIDADDTAESDWSFLAHVVRSRVRRACDLVLDRALATLGPAPSTTDPTYAARTADLRLYLQQDHGDRDVARIGEIVAERGGVTW